MWVFYARWELEVLSSGDSLLLETAWAVENVQMLAAITPERRALYFVLKNASVR